MDGQWPRTKRKICIRGWLIHIYCSAELAAGGFHDLESLVIRERGQDVRTAPSKERSYYQLANRRGCLQKRHLRRPYRCPCWRPSRSVGPVLSLLCESIVPSVGAKSTILGVCSGSPPFSKQTRLGISKKTALECRGRLSMRPLLAQSATAPLVLCTWLLVEANNGA